MDRLQIRQNVAYKLSARSANDAGKFEVVEEDLNHGSEHRAKKQSGGGFSESFCEFRVVLVPEKIASKRDEFTGNDQDRQIPESGFFVAHETCTRCCAGERSCWSVCRHGTS